MAILTELDIKIFSIFLDDGQVFTFFKDKENCIIFVEIHEIHLIKNTFWSMII